MVADRNNGWTNILHHIQRYVSNIVNLKSPSSQKCIFLLAPTAEYLSFAVKTDVSGVSHQRAVVTFIAQRVNFLFALWKSDFKWQAFEHDLWHHKIVEKLILFNIQLTKTKLNDDSKLPGGEIVSMCRHCDDLSCTLSLTQCQLGSLLWPYTRLAVTGNGWMDWWIKVWCRNVKPPVHKQKIKWVKRHLVPSSYN